MTSVETHTAMPATAWVPKPYHGPSKAEVLAMRKRYCHPSLFMLYRDPLMIVEGHMQWVWDETGKRYLDFFTFVASSPVGLNHPKMTTPEFLERIAAVATFDHGTGPHATEAASLVAAQGRRLGLTVVRERGRGSGESEAAWREARWRFLWRVARGFRARVATAQVQGRP